MRADRAALVGLLLAGCTVENEIGTCPQGVVINEVLASAHDAELPDTQRPVDWIELYNTEEIAVDLDGWSLSRTPSEHELELEAITLEPGGYLVVVAEAFEVEGHLSAGFDLNRDGDALFLRGPPADGRALCEEVAYPDQHADFSWQRLPDGGDDWCPASASTPGASNDDTPCVCEGDAESPWC